MRTLFEDAAESMTTWWDETTWLPFVEAENCNITGPGHQNKTIFAMDVNLWEWTCGTEGTGWNKHDVAHLWVVTDDGWETWHVAPHDAPGAVPVTCIWGQR